MCTARAIAIALLLAPLMARAAELTIHAPLEHQVIQRSTPGTGLVRIRAELSEACAGPATLEARVREGTDEPAWQTIGNAVNGTQVSGAFTAPSGGWWALDVRIMQDGREWARGSVPHVGIGEVFVVAGQSNSANHGEERQETMTGRVASFGGTAWRIAHDPQPGASGTMGSFMPPLGDELVRRLGVPVGFIPCGIGATSVREWLPKAARFAAPPTIETRVERLPDGSWASKGEAYAQLVARMRAASPYGFRAVLWHQGESDARQKDASRTLPGDLYRQYLETIILDSRRDAGWNVPWFVAQASYHGPGDEGSDEIRAAQAATWKDGLALAGPDSDALVGELRERNGQGVHFSGPGLRAHAVKWAEKILPWIESAWTAPRTVDDGTEWSTFEQLPECHSIGWVSRHVRSRNAAGWDGVLDEAKWGTPAPEQVLARNWDWGVTDAQWAEAVAARGEGRREEVRFDLWVPAGCDMVRGVVVISGHGSGTGLFKRPDLRAIAREMRLALFTFLGNPLQRGFWPRRLLFDRLAVFGDRAGHPEIAHAPLFLYGHSNGTGFSGLFAAAAPDRVWGWVSMRPGVTFQVYQPAAAPVPGLVIFGEKDPFFERPSRAENLAVVPTVRRKHGALWNVAVEPQGGHGPSEHTWPLVYAFLRSSFAARVPSDVDPRRGPVQLVSPPLESGHLGTNWDLGQGGFQTLPVAGFRAYSGDKATASWFPDMVYAAEWQTFHRDDQVPQRDSAAGADGLSGPAVALAPPPEVIAWKQLNKQPLSVAGHAGFVVVPEKPASGRPWIWRTSFPGFHAEVDEMLVREGFHVAHVDVVSMLGADAALEVMDAFYDRVRADHGLAERPALEAVSRGGLHAYRYAARRPGRIACIFADTPVMDLKSWPLAAKAAPQIRDAMTFYGFPSEDSLRQFRGNPLDLLEPVAAARIPLRHVISLTDKIVPPEDNTLEAQRRLRRLGWDIDVVVVADPEERLQGHHFNVPAADIERSVAFIKKHAAADRPDR
ncbi:MAG: hypothetical protein RLZZ111_629 [Planctomycetota bacterium]|jgi:hypothetical protein